MSEELNKAWSKSQIKAHGLLTIERPVASIGGVDASSAADQPYSGAPHMPAQPILQQLSTFEYRLAQEAINLRQQANGMPPGIRRTELLQRAAQIDAAGEVNSG